MSGRAKAAARSAVQRGEIRHARPDDETPGGSERDRHDDDSGRRSARCRGTNTGAAICLRPRPSHGLRAGWRDLLVQPAAEPRLWPAGLSRLDHHRRRAFLRSAGTTSCSRRFAGFMVVGPDPRRSGCMRRAVASRPANRSDLAADDFRQAAIRRPDPVHRRAAVSADAAVDARGRHHLCAVLRPAAVPGPRPHRPDAVHHADRMGDAARRQRRRRTVRRLLVRDQRVLDPDAAERAGRCADGDGNEHGAGLEQSAGDADLGRDRARPVSGQPGDRPCWA